MTPVAKDIKFTYEDYIHMPEDKRYELIGGEFVMVPSPVTRHQKILLKLSVILHDFILKDKRGTLFVSPYDVVLSDEDVVQPDIILVLKENENIITERNIKGTPDLLVEIVSPSTDYRDRVIKRKLYAKFGVKEYWIVDPDAKTIEVLNFMEEPRETSRIFTIEEVLTDPLLKGLKVPLKEIFEDD